MSLPKRLRIRARQEFQDIYRTGKTVYGAYFRAVIRKANSSKIGIVTPKKLGPAHDRQRVRRVFREAFRHLEKRLTQHREIVVFPNAKGKNIKMGEALRDLSLVLVKP